MSTTTTIANEAMALIRAKNKIEDIDSSLDPNAMSARMFLDEHINEMLEQFDIKAFSRVQTLGNITADEPPPFDWANRFAIPPDCIIPRQVLISGFVRNSTPIAFDVEMLEDGSASSIVCDQPAISLRYTSNQFKENVSRWPHNFRRAVVFRLAASLATAIKENPNMATQMMNFYVDSVNTSMFVNESGRFKGESQDPRTVRARKGIA